MLKNFLLCFAAATFIVACAQNTPTTTTKQFGAAVTAENAVPYDEMLAKMGTADSMNIKVTGLVKEVCQKKGCWMTLVSDKPGSPEMRVTFKDYAFFMPKDIAGKHVVIEGVAFVETISVEMLRHYAEDANKSPEEIAAITEPQKEISFEAAGVLILD